MEDFTKGFTVFLDFTMVCPALGGLEDWLKDMGLDLFMGCWESVEASTAAESFHILLFNLMLDRESFSANRIFCFQLRRSSTQYLRIFIHKHFILKDNVIIQFNIVEVFQGLNIHCSFIINSLDFVLSHHPKVWVEGMLWGAWVDLYSLWLVSLWVTMPACRGGGKTGTTMGQIGVDWDFRAGLCSGS